MSAPLTFAYFDNVYPINLREYRRWLDRVIANALTNALYQAQVDAGMRPSEAEEIALQTGVSPPVEPHK